MAFLDQSQMIPFHKLTITIALLLSVNCLHLSSQEFTSEIIMPTTDFTVNFSNFPRAWTVSKGKDVKIAVVVSAESKETDWAKKINSIAPEALVTKKTLDEFLKKDSEDTHIWFMTYEIDKKDYNAFAEAVSLYAENNLLVIHPAYFGRLDVERDFTNWKTFIKQIHDAGALITGAHGRAFEIGDPLVWQDIPVDIFSLDRKINGWELFNPGSRLNRDVQNSGIYVAGSVALLKSINTGLEVNELRKIISENCPKVFYSLCTWEGDTMIIAHMQRGDIGPDVPEDVLTIESDAYMLSYNDAALLLGLKDMKSGQWAREVLESEEANKIATGKGITVAILDHSFDQHDPALAGRIVNAGCVIDGGKIFDDAHHGTWMSADLVSIAPDVNIMPVTFRSFEDDEDYAANFIAGINYAVKNGADIISVSHEAIPKDHLPELDAAISKATEKGITLVYIHYQGELEEVVVSAGIEFAAYDKKGNKNIYVICTNFKDEASFPYTWGLSQTAPLVSGVIAMMKEINPGLTPVEINKILYESQIEIPEGGRILNAKLALVKSKK